jgi:hypothetical protein
MEADHIRIPDGILLDNPLNARPEVPGWVPVGQVSGLSPDALEVVEKSSALLASSKVLLQLSRTLRREISVQIGG